VSRFFKTPAPPRSYRGDIFERMIERGVAMEMRSLMVPAAGEAARIVRNVAAGQLDAPTPCAGWDVRALVNHMITWAGPGETAARKEPPAGGAVDESRDHVAEGGWAERYTDLVTRMARAWQDPAALEGTTSLTGRPDGMPAPFVFWMMTGECVLHGWDLAAATGQETRFPDELIEVVHAETVPTAGMGREYGVFGEEVKVSESAPALERLLGLTGRDPHWRP
jgi:uncharacterized protein (TIGR03086 family)